ncbi:MAG: AAA family ATPase [Thermoleophilaceae bacterium]
MRVTDVELRDFRNYERATVDVGDGLSVVAGPNGAGKTNLLEAIYFGCVGRSPRTSNERELVRAGAAAARVAVDTVEDGGTTHRLEVGLEPGAAKVHRVDGSPVDSLSRTPARPLLSVFLPERLELVKGPPLRAAGTWTPLSQPSGPRGRRPARPTPAPLPSAMRCFTASGPAPAARPRWPPGMRSLRNGECS